MTLLSQHSPRLALAFGSYLVRQARLQPLLPGRTMETMSASRPLAVLDLAGMHADRLRSPDHSLGPTGRSSITGLHICDSSITGGMGK